MRNQSLDVLRGAAVLLVFCYHSPGALLISRFGWIGVDLFFVLSGYLVSGLLFREYQQTGTIRAARFLLRRGFKIYPQFYTLIAVTLAIAIATAARPHPHNVLAELLFIQNYLPGLWTHTWSLGVEEHFYLLLTFAIVVLARRGGENPFRRLPLAIAVVCANVLALRAMTWWAGAHAESSTVFPSHLRVDSLALGVLIGYGQAFHGEPLGRWMKRWSNWLGPASIGLIAPVTFLRREDPFMVTIGFSMLAWGFGLLLMSVIYPAKPVRFGRASRAVAALGRVSYGFYLWHGPVIVWSDALGLPVFANLGVTFALSLLAASVTTRTIEIPFLKLRDRWTARQPSLVATPRAA